MIEIGLCAVVAIVVIMALSTSIALSCAITDYSERKKHLKDFRTLCQFHVFDDCWEMFLVYILKYKNVDVTKAIKFVEKEYVEFKDEKKEKIINLFVD